MHKALRTRHLVFSVLLLLSVGARAQTSPAEEIKVRVQSFEKIVEHEKNIQKKTKQQMNLLVSYSELAKSMRTGSSEQTPQLAEVLNKAAVLGKTLLASKYVEEKKKPYIHYLLGVALVDLNRTEESMVQLKKAIALDPTAEYVTSVSIFLGDSLFYEQKWEQAKKAYKQFYAKLPASEKEYVDTKLAWILLRQSNFSEAQKQLESQLKSGGSDRVRSDAMKALAYSLAERGSQDEAVEKSRTVFTAEPQRLEFLTQFYSQIQKDPKKPRDKVWAEIVKLEKRPAAKAEIWLNELRAYRKQKQTDQHYKTLQQMIADLKEDFIFSESNEALQTALQPESEWLLAEYYKAFKSNAAIYDGAAGLLKLADFHLKFKDLKKRGEVLALKTDVLTRSKDDKAFLSFSDELLMNDVKFVDVTRLRELRVDALRRLAVNDTSMKVRLRTELETLSTEGKTAHKGAVAEELYATYSEAKNWSAAEQQAALLFKNKPTAENLALLFTSWFEQGACDKISSFDSKLTNNNIQSYRRECALKLAENAKSSGGNKESYYKNILYFIKSSSDAVKRDLALKDLYANLKKDGRDDLIEQYLLNDHFQFRFDESLSPYAFSTATKFTYLGQWVPVRKLMGDCNAKPVCPDAEVIATMATVGAEPKLNPSSWGKAKSDQKTYFLSLWALLKPKEFIAAMMPRQNWTETEKKLVAIAAQVSDVDWNLATTKPLFTRIQDLIPKSKHPVGVSPALKALQKISFPPNVKNHKLKDSELMAKAEQVRKTRSHVLIDLKAASTTQKIALLEAAAKAEEKAGQMIEFSPVPKVLAGPQIQEYKTGLKNLAAEFYKQQEQYSASLATLTSARNANEADKPLPGFKVHEDWLAKIVLAKIPELESIWKKGDIKSSLLILDFAHQQKVITDQAYYRGRAGVLLSSSSANGMKEYVLGELQEFKQEAVIKFWRSR